MVTWIKFWWYISPLFHSTTFMYLMNLISYKIFKRFGVILNISTLLPVQKVSCVHSNCSSVFINFIHFADKTVAVNFRRDIDTKFLRVTLAFPIKKQQCKSFSLTILRLTILRLLTCPYPWKVMEPYWFCNFLNYARFYTKTDIL